jgi:hypothetical protein
MVRSAAFRSKALILATVLIAELTGKAHVHVLRDPTRFGLSLSPRVGPATFASIPFASTAQRQPIEMLSIALVNSRLSPNVTCV